MVGLEKSRNSARVYSLFGRGVSLRRIGDEVGMAKQSVASHVSTLQRRADKVAAVAAYSPEYLDFVLRALVQWSSEVKADADGNVADPIDVQRAIVDRLQTAAEELSERIAANPTLGLIDNWTKPECGGRAETEYQEVQ